MPVRHKVPQSGLLILPKECFAAIHFFGIAREMDFLRVQQGNDVSIVPAAPI